MLMRRRGIRMPRAADVQAAWRGATAVERNDIQPGDLLFFGSPAKYITHTGMYIVSNGHPVAQISRLDDQPWRRLLVACRRVK